jgi:ferredoxin
LLFFTLKREQTFISTISPSNTMPKYKVDFSKETCIGCEACNTYGDNWTFDYDEYKAVPVKLELDEIGGNHEAEEACPVDAIKIITIKK